MRNNLFFVLLTIITTLIATSCSPTYPREKIMEGVKQLCKKEYSVDVDVKLEGSTLGVKIPLEGLFNQETLEIVPAAFNKVDGVMLSVSRVALSSDKSIDFYTVITYDKNVPGAEIIMTRYVPDLRRYFYGDISRDEFTKRMVFEVRFDPQGIIDAWFGGFTLKGIKLDEFMCTQASRRITDEFKENNSLAGKFKVVSCKGKLQNGIFNFAIDISREGLPMSELIHGKSWHDKVLEVALQKISHVVYIYSFRDFTKISVQNKFDNKVVEITNKEIDSWRKRRVKID